MKVVGIVGSPRIGGNTEFLVRTALDELEMRSFDVEMIHLGEKNINGCRGCMKCPETCIIQDDMTKLYPMIEQADGILVGSPTYFGQMTAQLKAFMDRSVLLRRRSMALKNKIGAALSVGGVRTGGQFMTNILILNWMLIHDMIVVSCEGVLGTHIGASSMAFKKDDSKSDDLGIESAKKVANRLAEVMNMGRAE
ncbi:MAG: flavodoxin family protein [Theionarchaea archaeon]|nr:flavodoxin family protein [Theionarchaea archaeon]